MLSNYLKSNYRHVQKSKGFSLINLIGLTIGLTCSLLILIYIRYETSYDRHINRIDDVYRIIMDQPDNFYMGKSTFTVTPAPIKEAIESTIPEIELVGRLSAMYGGLVTRGRNSFPENNIFLADPEIIEIFDLQMSLGDGSNSLKKPYTVILSQSMVHKYFGDDDPVGKTIKKNNQYDLIITGVFKDMPQNSHIQFDMLESFQTLYATGDKESIERWDNNSYFTYFRANPNTDLDLLNNKLELINKAHLNKDLNHQYLVEPIQSIHLHGNHNFEIKNNSDIRLVYLFSGIGIFILLIASLNYMNLATARSTNRSREVGMRKVVGASRNNLLFQFLGESILFSVIGLFLSLIMAIGFLPRFAILIHLNLPVALLFNPLTLLYSLVVSLVLGILSGVYPSIYLSSFSPISIFRGINKRGHDRTKQLRNGLVVVQFIISIVLISGTLIMQKQMQFIRNKDLGFQKDHIFTVRLRNPELKKNYEPLQNELTQLAGVMNITATRQLPITIRSSSTPTWEGKTEDQSLHVYKMYVDINTLNFFGMKLAKGRQFSEDHLSDVDKSVILNQAAVRAIGWKHPLGKEFKFNKKEPKSVIGVLEDFHFSSLHLPIAPVAVQLLKSDKSWRTMQYFAIRVTTDNLQQTINSITQTVNKFSPDYPSEFRFLDERVETLYRSEKRLAASFNLFTAIAIGIACLGLLGLASFMAEKRAKEISIRKILGATVAKITLLLTQSFLKWVALANLLACPIVYIVMKKWLNQFSYRISLGADTFLLAALLSLGIAMATVGIQTVKAAVAKPADVLRRE